MNIFVPSRGPATRRSSRVLPVLMAAAMAAGGLSASRAGVAVPQVGNLRMASSGNNVGLDNGGLAYHVVEADQRADLNGDGDLFDSVAHVWDPTTGTRNLGVAANRLTALDGGRVAFSVTESSQGDVDLNGDGDVGDTSVHVWDPSGRTTNLRLGTSLEEIALSGGRLAMQISEADQGGTDLNRDGDVSDLVIHIWDPASGTTLNLGVASVIETMAAMPGGGIVFLVGESNEGARDRNGDGTLGDRVPAIWEPSTSEINNLGLAASTRLVLLGPDRVAFLVLEADQGGRDANDDGDALDKVVHIWDRGTGIRNLRLAANSDTPTFVNLHSGQLAFAVIESAQGGRDLNGDGDGVDDVVHIWDPGTGTKNLGRAASPGVLGPVPGGAVTMHVSEADQGGRDLNGDGDVRDSVLHMWDAVHGTRNLRLAADESAGLEGGRLALRVSESSQDSTDLNGDGDTIDAVLHIWDPQTEAVENTGVLVVSLTALEGGRVLFHVWESFQGNTDLNGDGDATDWLLYVWAPGSGVTSLGLADPRGHPSPLRGGGVAVRVSELQHHGRDLNGDGDSADHVVHIVSWSPGWPLPSSFAGAPDAPHNVTAQAGDQRAIVSWEPSAYDGGAPITGYIVAASPGGRTVDAAAGASTLTVNGLENGVAFTFTVQARNDVGVGPTSQPSPVVVPSAVGSEDPAATPGEDPGDDTAPSSSPSTGSTGAPQSTTGPTPEPTGTPGTAPGTDGNWSTTRPQATPSGYWMVRRDGAVHAFGDAAALGDAPTRFPAVDLEPTPTGNGYWVIDETGRVFPFGDARWHGNADEHPLVADERVTSLAATPSGSGYWVFTTKGRVFTFGDAVWFGDMSTTMLNGSVLESIPTPTGRGYYMVASDGGIFSFGDAHFHGSMGNQRLNAPVQSLVPNRAGTGYWLVASDGGIFSFAAEFRGSMGAIALNGPITGMVSFGNGYLMVGEDGGIFNFSDRPFHGSLGATPIPHPVTAVAALPN